MRDGLECVDVNNTGRYEVTKELIEQARDALDDMDDFARMANVVASGPLQVLSKAIDVLEQQSNQVEELVSAQATIAGLREYLSENIYSFDHSGSRTRDGNCYCECCDSEFGKPHKPTCILTHPTNQDALHEALARECERLANMRCWNAAQQALINNEAAAHRARKEQK